MSCTVRHNNHRRRGKRDGVQSLQNLHKQKLQHSNEPQ